MNYKLKLLLKQNTKWKVKNITKIRPLQSKPIRILCLWLFYFICFKKLFLLICCWYIMFVLMNFNVFCVEIRNTWSLQLFWCSFSCTYCIPRTVRAFPKFKNHAHISNSRACFCMGHFVWFCEKKNMNMSLFALMFCFSNFVVWRIKHTCTLQLCWCSFSWTYCT